MQLSDFNTLSEAKTYVERSYRLISPGIASQFLGLQGILSKVRAKTSDETVVQVIPGVDTTLAEVCNMVLVGCQNTGFATDPTEQDGELNRAAAQILVEHSILSAEQAEDFFALGTTDSTPFAHTTKHEFDVAKGNITRRILKTNVPGDIGLLELGSQAPERHNPRITTAEGKRVNSFYHVQEAGVYTAKIPAEYSGHELYVDDSYGVTV